MTTKLYCMGAYYVMKAKELMRRTVKEQSGVDGLIVTLLLVGVALILGFAFKSSLKKIVEDLWSNLVKDGSVNTTQSDVVSDWSWGG